MAALLVLIVDDNEKNVKLARDVLRFAGFRTLEAGTDGASVSGGGDAQQFRLLLQRAHS